MDETQTEPKGMQEEDSKNLPELSLVALYAQRENTLLQRQALIAKMSCAIIQDPENNMKKLRELRELWNDPDPTISTGNRKLILLSLTEIFKDILPDYKIRISTEAEKQQASTKDTKQLRQYEENLLHNYKVYLQLLEECIGKASNKKIEKTELQKSFKLLAVKCLCQVFVRKPSFNFSKNIIDVLVRLVAVHNQQILKVICETIQQVFKEDKTGEISLEIVRGICRTVKAKHFRVEPQVLEVFLHLRIKDLKAPEEKKKELTYKERMKQWSRKERKMYKKKKELNKQLEEAAVEVNKNKVLQAKTETISAIFTLFFIILKQEEESKLLSPVLAGLAKFAHIINVDFFDDLFKVFGKLLDSGSMSIDDVINMTLTAFTILSGQGEALNIDPQHFYTHLYKVIPLFCTEEGKECIAKIPELVKMMFLERKKKLTKARVLAFIKRLTNVSVFLPGHLTAVVLKAAKLLIDNFPYADILLDTEFVGSGVYQPNLDDPEYCNAHNTTILNELHLLVRNENNSVKECARQILKMAPDQKICLKSTDELVESLKTESETDVKLQTQSSKRRNGQG